MSDNKQARREMASGNSAFAEAMRQINPDVVAAYPITPSTDIPEKFAKFVANGQVDTEFVPVESEHSAISACVTASISGARVMTASSANGIALMHEIFPIAAGFRAPIVLGLVNRCAGAPLCIHCDHSDSMPQRDSGWIQIYCENAQEVYDTVFLAVRLAEDKRVLTPVFVCQDGFITSHCFEPVSFLDDETAKNFVGERVAQNSLLDTDNPVSYGSFTMDEDVFEIKRAQIEGLRNVPKVYEEISAELEKATGRNYPMIEEYKTDDAEFVIVIMSSATGVVKDTVDSLREKGIKAGCLRIRFFRPFPREAVANALKGKRGVAVLDRSMSPGGTAPLSAEVKSALYMLENRPKLQEYLFGIGGRDFFETDAIRVFEKMAADEYTDEAEFIGLRG